MADLPGLQGNALDPNAQKCVTFFSNNAALLTLSSDSGSDADAKDEDEAPPISKPEEGSSTTAFLTFPASHDRLLPHVAWAQHPTARLKRPAGQTNLHRRRLRLAHLTICKREEAKAREFYLCCPFLETV